MSPILHRPTLLLKVALVAMLPWLVCAEESRPNDDAGVFASMHSLAGDVQVLLPLIYGREQLDPADRELIADTLGDMQHHVANLAPMAASTTTYQISYEILASQLKQARSELTQGRDAYAVDLLRSAVSVCATCHTQDDRTASWLAPAVTGGSADSFVNGEFLFMTRQYDAAFTAYESWLQQHETLVDNSRTRTAFERLLLTALQVKKSPTALQEVIAEFVQHEGLAVTLEKDLRAWRDGLAELQTQTDISTHPDRESLGTLVETWLGKAGDKSAARIYLPETRRPQIVWLRGELYRALNEETDESMVPQWLYWLAVSDRLLEYRFYYSLADMYLKQCMLEYSSHPIARHCYGEYENYLIFFNTGSSGTHLPPESDAELEMLKSRVFGNPE